MRECALVWLTQCPLLFYHSVVNNRPLLNVLEKGTSVSEYISWFAFSVRVST